MALNIDQGTYEKMRAITLARMKELYPVLSLKFDSWKAGEITQEDFLSEKEADEWNFLIASMKILTGEYDFPDELSEGTENLDVPENMIWVNSTSARTSVRCAGVENPEMGPSGPFWLIKRISLNSREFFL